MDWKDAQVRALMAQGVYYNVSLDMVACGYSRDEAEERNRTEAENAKAREEAEQGREENPTVKGIRHTLLWIIFLTFGVIFAPGLMPLALLAIFFLSRL